MRYLHMIVLIISQIGYNVLYVYIMSENIAQEYHRGRHCIDIVDDISVDTVHVHNTQVYTREQDISCLNG